MRCGAKCFMVEMEFEGEKQIKSVTTRTPAEARKVIRMEYGRDVKVLSVVEEKKKGKL